MSEKRKRSVDDMDSDECLPISKRINRLQIGSSSSCLLATNEDVRLVNNNLHKNLNGASPGEVEENFVSLHGNQSSNQLSPGVGYSYCEQFHHSSLSHSNHLNSQYSTSDIVPSTSAVPQCSTSQQSTPNFVEHRNSFNQPLQVLDGEGPYEPELSSGENPHYYAANEVLYNAHIMRNQRHFTKDRRL